MSSNRRRARILTPTDQVFHKSRELAQALLDAGSALFICTEPVFTVQLLAFETIRNTILPRDCRRFKLEVIATWDRVRNGRPFNITSEEFIQIKRLLGDIYRPTPHNQVRRDWDRVQY